MALVSDLMVHAQASGEGSGGSRFRASVLLNHCNASVEPFVPAQPVVAQHRAGAQGTSQYWRDLRHRQTRVGDVPSGKNLSDPNDPLSKENALLDKKIKSICRGC
jgi:hypothetical protein